MNDLDERLHPSFPENKNGGAWHRTRRRPGSWCTRRTELLMVTCIGTLAVLLLLAKLPLDTSFFGSGGSDTYLSRSAYPTDPLPLITAHEIRSDKRKRPAESYLPNDVLPESDLAPDELMKLDLERPGIDTRVAFLRATAGAALTLQDFANTSRYMHTAITAPVAEEPPRLRLGSMLIEYPLSALKKAVEGIVIVRFTVEPDGRAYGIDVVSGLEPECDAAVIDALREARFIPGQFRGRDVPALSQMAVRFKIEKTSSGYY